jgi:uncharacterized membrane protein YccC
MTVLGRARDWLGTHDPGYGALRRAVRTAIVMPGAFALCLKLIGNPVMAPFAAFGAISTLLLVDFRGPLRDRVQDQVALVLAGAGLVCLGTLCSRSDGLAVAAMAVLGVAIIFSGVVSSVLAGASTALLLAFILPVSLPGPASQIPARAAGWGIAGGLSVIAITLLWPAPAVDPLQGPLVRAARALAARLRSTGPQPEAEAREALAALSARFLATPYRPTGLSTATRAGIRLVDELAWLGGIVLGDERGSPTDGPPVAAVRAVEVAAAAALEQAAELLTQPAGAREGLARARRALAGVTRGLPDAVCLTRPEGEPAALVSALDPAFRAQEASFMVSRIARNVDLVAAARARSWPARALGRQPPGIGGPLASARERAGAHIALRSVTARNALRGGAALGLAVLLARLIGVEHAFWVSFGTLSILRSNALSTGQTFARALAGTALGFVIGAGIVLAIGTDTTLLWILLPFAVLFAGIAPAAISFAAGQASFTVVLFILFNILAPAGWRIGLVRIEDIALGGGTSLVVGLLFWPRGAGSALGRALADAYAESTAYLASAVAHAIACCAPGLPEASAGPLPEATRAAAAARRLDDTFRTYLAERGPKQLPLSGTTTLVTGAAVVRLAADAILQLWEGEEDAGSTVSRVGAARELLTQARALEQWYGGLEAALPGLGALPDPDPPDPGADERLRATIDRDLRSSEGQAGGAAVRVVWTGDHLDGVRRLQAPLVAAGRERL